MKLKDVIEKAKVAKSKGYYLAATIFLPCNIELLADTEGDPLRKLCCKFGDAFAPADLLQEGKFPERIAWLREHYENKHPGMWGKMQAQTMPGQPGYELRLEVRRLWNLACKWENIPANPRFVVFSNDNPYQKEYNEAMMKWMRFMQVRTASTRPETTAKGIKVANPFLIDNNLLKSIGEENRAVLDYEERERRQKRWETKRQVNSTRRSAAEESQHAR